MTHRIICLGNRNACVYRKHPQPPPGLPLDKLELWATMVCDLSLDGIPKIGDAMTDSNGAVAYTIGASHREALVRELVEKPVLAAVLDGKKLCTTIHVSPQSTLMQAVTECLHVWRGDNKMGLPHSAGKPAWIAGNWPALVGILQDELEIPEVRELEIEQ